MDSNIKTVVNVFLNTYNSRSVPKISMAPGRVNLIGEHTDYNDGFVFPMGINKTTHLAFAPRTDKLLHITALDFNESAILDLTTLDKKPTASWVQYIAGMALAFQQANLPVHGANMVIQSSVPIGAGLSSSAALEMAVARAFCELSDIPWNPTKMAKLGQWAENHYVGVSCGIMDQFAVAKAVKNHALLLDCRSLETQTIPLPDGICVVVMDTGVRRSLSSSAYNERRSACESVVATIAQHFPEIKALRDVTPEMLFSFKNQLAHTDYKRASHVVHENQRPLHLAKAFQENNLELAGTLMNDSHQSLKELYEVSSPELDFITEQARLHPACYGARLTGAGFGGCAIALIQKEATQDFIETVQSAYQKRFPHTASFYPTTATDGATIKSGL